jgi:hypothetical protein
MVYFVFLSILSLFQIELKSFKKLFNINPINILVNDNSKELFLVNFNPKKILFISSN